MWWRECVAIEFNSRDMEPMGPAPGDKGPEEIKGREIQGREDLEV